MSECSYGSPFYESSGRRKYGCPWGDAPRLGRWNLASRYRRDVTFMSWRQNDDMWNRFETIPERYRRQTSCSCHIANRLYRLDRRLAKNVKRVSKPEKKHREIFEIFQKYFMKYFRAKMSWHFTSLCAVARSCGQYHRRILDLLLLLLPILVKLRERRWTTRWQHGAYIFIFSTMAESVEINIHWIVFVYVLLQILCYLREHNGCGWRTRGNQGCYKVCFNVSTSSKLDWYKICVIV